MNPGSWKDQLESHLESWRNAGVEYLSGTLEPLVVPQPPKSVSAAAISPSRQSPAPHSPGEVKPSVPQGNQNQSGSTWAGGSTSLFQEGDHAAPRRTPTQETTAAPKPSTAEGPPIFQLPMAPTPARERALKDLAYKVSQCRSCPELVRNRSRTVFGIGPLDVELAVIGEAPGFNEDQQGEPFVGPAGQLLDRMLAACGFRREEVFICNILRCRPPENRPPLPDEAANCRGFLVQTLELVRPKHLCLMGASAARYLLQVEKTIGMLRGKDLTWRGIPATATYHPSYLLRTPAKKAEAWADLQEMLKKMGKEIPKK